MSATDEIRRMHIDREVYGGYPADPETGDVPEGYVATCIMDGEAMPCTALRALDEAGKVGLRLAGAVDAAVAAQAALLVMRWREQQERGIRFQQDVLPAEDAARRSLEEAEKGIRVLVHDLARDVERERLKTVPEQSEWHIHVHGVAVESQWQTCGTCDIDDHTCPGCGQWLYHGKGVCGPCAEDLEQEAQEQQQQQAEQREEQGR